MTRMTWGDPTKRQFENGVSNGMFKLNTVFAPFPWNGLVSVDEQPLGGDPVSFYLDGEKYAMISQYEEFAGSIKSLQIPTDFRPAIGEAQVVPGLFVSQQPKIKFDFAYKTQTGDANNPLSGEQIHICYGLMVKTPQRSHQTRADDSDIEEITLDFNSKHQPLPGFKSVGHLVIDSRGITASKYQAMDNLIFGSAEYDPQIPSATVVKSYMNIFS